MTQMVLPQTPAPGMHKDAGQDQAGNKRDAHESGAGESRYESVSRTEQKRLERQQSGHADKPGRSNASKQSDANADKSRDGVARHGQTSGQDKASGKDTSGSNADTALEMETTTPLTFAELQALLAPAAPGGTRITAAGNPVAPPGSELFAGLVEGKPGQFTTGNSGGQIAGLPLTDALVPVAGGKAGNQDTLSLFTASRPDAAVELMSQPPASQAAGKLAADTQVPLRGYTTSVDVPVNHAEWGDKLMGKLSWLTTKNLSTAEIHLTPPDMGPMEVRVRVHNDQASITVHAANPVVRDQLELNSHRLRDMLDEQGLSLAGFDVSDNSQNQSREQGTGEGEASSAGPGSGVLSAADGGDGETQAGSLDLSWNGAVDVFA